MARAVPDERDRILVKLSLPRDALIEFASKITVQGARYPEKLEKMTGL